jgi:CBS domain-containing protein
VVLARDLMTRRVLTLRDDRTVQEAAAFLSENAITGAPVVDAAGKLVGVVALADIAEQAGVTTERPPRRISSGYFHEGWEGRISPDELRDLTVTDAALLVRDIMTPTVFTIPDSTPVEKIARTMIAGRIRRLFVTAKGRVVGIITTMDLLTLLTGKPPTRATPRETRGRFPSVDTARLDRSRKTAGPGRRRHRASKGGSR